MSPTIRYWCAGCGREVPPEEVSHFHSLGAIHMIKGCRSGKVTQLKEATSEEK